VTIASRVASDAHSRTAGVAYPLRLGQQMLKGEEQAVVRLRQAASTVSTLSAAE
jgi:hypothetical protein